MDAFTEHLEQVNATLKKQEAVQRISTDTVILVAGVCMTLYSGLWHRTGDKHRKCNYLYHRHDEFIWTDSGIVCAFKQPESDACKWKSCIEPACRRAGCDGCGSNVEFRMKIFVFQM